ncbi:TonB-dependent receptor plug domain-containing protein [Chryseolinea lacunae]|uniref:TonB-dependent receptor n=1 Tax=Chryseolinea lacunae TaxID=2801331 RepID=A0ABS1KNH7_9BACT|nr:TonB-dependent receptor [Chryseolinea lacunae]MBL0741009.1 TonB-dependent receptor [Chryseolinea lacunae]
MKKEKKVWAISLIVLWYLAPNQTHAQDSLKTSRLDEVVVTATKFPKSQGETGKVLTVIDEEQLAHSAGKDLSQLLNEQVGLVVTGANSNPGKDKSVFLRGAKSDYTLVLLDGVPVNDPSGIGGAFDLRLLPIDQIERIEILKGSQSTLYGSDAIAGVINIITKKKGSKPFGVFGSVSAGSYGTSKLSAGVSGSTSLLDYNVGYTRFKTDGISEAEDKDNTGTFDKDGYDQNSVQANVGVRATDKLTLRPFVRYSKFEGKYDAGSFSDEPRSTYDAKLLNFGLNGQYAFSKGTLNLQYAHDKVERSYTSPDYVDPTMLVTSAYDGGFDNAEVFYQHNLTDHLQLLAGVNYQHSKMTSGDAVDSSLHITSPYASFFVKDLNGFSLEVGGRYVDHSVFGNTFIYSFNPSYLINRQVKVFANYSTGFKAPMLDQLFNPFYGNKDLKPEESKNLEGGVQFVSSDNKFDVRGTVFSRKIENVIIYKYPGYMNLDKQEDLGFEIESTVNVNSKLKIGAFYAFVDGEVNTKTSAERDTTYHNLIRRPKHSVGVNVGYQLSSHLFVSANFKTFSNRSDLFFNNNTFATESVTLDAYQLLDLYAEYKFLQGKLKLFVEARNVLDKKFTEVYGYSTMGFNAYSGLSFNF